MLSRDIIKEIISFRGMSQAKLAEAAGFKSQSNINGILNRHSSMRVETLVQLAKAMDCEVVVRDKTDPSREWIVTDGEEQAE